MADLYIALTISFYQIKLKPVLILLVSLIVGLFTGHDFVFIRMSTMKDI